jgi:ankyrin repeat protein
MRILKAAEHGRQDLVEMLVTYGVNVNEAKNEERALHVAAKYGKDKVVKILLERGADVRKFTELCSK